MFKRRSYDSRPGTPKIARIPLPDMTEENDTFTTKAMDNDLFTTPVMASPVKRHVMMEPQIRFTTQRESSAAGRAPSRRREDSYPPYAESVITSSDSTLSGDESPLSSTRGRPSVPKQKVVRVKLVAMKMPDVNLHWQLLPYYPRLNKPQLRFDIAHRIDFIRFTHAPRPLSETELDKAAADDKLCEMFIECDRFPDWPVRVRRADGIRCRDVFTAIYETYNQVLTPAERKRIPAADLEGCERAFRSRCRTSGNLPKWEEAQGLRRADLLRGESFFLGLTRPKPSGDWVMHVGALSAAFSSHLF